MRYTAFVALGACLAISAWFTSLPACDDTTLAKLEASALPSICGPPGAVGCPAACVSTCTPNVAASRCDQTGSAGTVGGAAWWMGACNSSWDWWSACALGNRCGGWATPGTCGDLGNDLKCVGGNVACNAPVNYMKCP